MKLENRVFLSCALGSTITWYDFTIFVTATSLVFKELFFSGYAYLIPVMAISIGFLMRTLGSMLFGNIGDRYGRKGTLIFTLYLTGIATILIGLLPTNLGVYGAVALVVLRMIQALALGGEWAATSTMLMEHHINSPKRTFVTSVLSSGWAVASLLAAGVFMLVTSFGDQWFQEWGWRIPFMLSAVLMILGVYIRHKVTESPEFVKTQQQGHIARVPLTILFRDHWKKIALGALAMQLCSSWAYIVPVFGFNYALTAGLVTRGEIGQIQLIGAVAMLAALIFWGWIGDKVSRVRVFQGMAVISLIMTFPIMSWLAQGQLLWALLSLVLVMCPVFAVSAGFFTEIFPSHVRQSGSGTTFNLGGILGAALTPPLAQIAFESTKSLDSVAWIFVICSLVSLVAATLLPKLKETSNESR